MKNPANVVSLSLVERKPVSIPIRDPKTAADLADIELQIQTANSDLGGVTFDMACLCEKQQLLYCQLKALVARRLSVLDSAAATHLPGQDKEDWAYDHAHRAFVKTS